MTVLGGPGPNTLPPPAASRATRGCLKFHEGLVTPPCLNSRSSLGRKSSWDGALDKTFETKQLGAEPLCVTWRSGERSPRVFPPLISPVTLRGDLDFLSTTWGPLALVHEWQRKGRTVLRGMGSCREGSSEGLGLCGEERSAGAWPGLRQAGAGSEMLAQRSPASVLRLRNVLLPQPPVRLLLNGETPRSGDTAFHPLNWPLLLLGLFRSFWLAAACWPSGGRGRAAGLDGPCEIPRQTGSSLGRVRTSSQDPWAPRPA